MAKSTNLAMTPTFVISITALQGNILTAHIT